VNFRSAQYFLIFGIFVLVSVNFSWGQSNYFNQFPSVRGNVPPSYPYGITGEMDVPSIMQLETMKEDEPMTAQEQARREGFEILFDKKINPDEYYIGPGDEIGVYLWGELDREYKNTVTPEGYFLLPTVGMFLVADFSLAEVREILKNGVRSKYKTINTDVTLVRPRQFKLYISGLVLQPGMISTNSLERVSDVIERAGLMFVEKLTNIGEVQSTRALTREVVQNESNLIKKGASQRSIIVSRGDTQIDVDLLRYRKIGDIDSNPYVRSGDHLHVPPYMGDIIIDGEINDPDRYEYKPGDRIADLVNFGGGLTVLADTTKATLVRFEEKGTVPVSTDVDLYDAIIYNPDDPRYILNESDRLYIRSKYDFKVIANIYLDGQVKYPGQYAIMSGVTTLSDVIRMAGGFTDKANLEEARLVRQTTSAIRDLEYERLQRMQAWEMNEEEYDYYKSRNRSARGEITTDFTKLFIDNDLSLDVVLQHRDNIFIPYKRELISVSGAVNQPGYVKIEPGENYEFYINKAGGYKWDAHKSKVRIIKAKTGQRFRPGKTVYIEGGDIIHVPEKTPINKWEAFRDSAQIFANVATIIILARRLAD